MDGLETRRVQELCFAEVILKTYFCRPSQLSSCVGLLTPQTIVRSFAPQPSSFQKQKLSMRKIALPALVLAAIAFSTFSFRNPDPEGFKWYTWEEAVELNKTNPKKIVVDVFTNWCGWCKKMDKGAFIDPAVMAYLSANFYPVKLNAEQREEIKFSEETFGFIPNDNGRGGVHSLAYALMDGRSGYPTLVYLNEKYERIMISPGFKEAPDLLKELRFAAEEFYNKTTWEKYKEGKE